MITVTLNKCEEKNQKKKKTSVKRSARLRTSPLFVAGQEIVI